MACCAALALHCYAIKVSVTLPRPLLYTGEQQSVVNTRPKFDFYKRASFQPYSLTRGTFDILGEEPQNLISAYLPSMLCRSVNGTEFPKVNSADGQTTKLQQTITA